MSMIQFDYEPFRILNNYFSLFVTNSRTVKRNKSYIHFIHCYITATQFYVIYKTWFLFPAANKGKSIMTKCFKNTTTIIVSCIVLCVSGGVNMRLCACRTEICMAVCMKMACIAPCVCWCVHAAGTDYCWWNVSIWPCCEISRGYKQGIYWTQVFVFTPEDIHRLHTISHNLRLH